MFESKVQESRVTFLIFAIRKTDTLMIARILRNTLFLRVRVLPVPIAKNEGMIVLLTKQF